MQPLLTVIFYASASGREPVREWLRALTPEDRRALGLDIKTVQYGWPLGMPVVRKMQRGLWEVRSTLSNNDARLFFTVIGSNLIVLHAFLKSSAKTPKAELELALSRMKEVHHE